MVQDHSAPVPMRTLGTTGLRVTAVCVGTAEIGDMKEAFAYSVAEEDALATIRAIFDGPLNFVDTAAAYGDGESERRIGLVLRERGGLPPGFVLASKADRDPQTGDFSGDQMRRSVERSLRLLGLERLQLCYLHDPEVISFEEAMARGGAVEGLQRCKDEGLIEHLGVAGGPIDLEMQFVETGIFEVVLSHNRYTLLNDSASSLWDAAVERRVACVNAAPYGSGILSRGPGNYPRYAYQVVTGDLLERARRIEQICLRQDVPLAAAALQFSMRDPRITATIVGLDRPELVKRTVELAGYAIPAEVWSELESVPRTVENPEEHRWS